MATNSHISVNIVDPVVAVDTLVWTRKHVYVDLSDTEGLTVTLTLTDLSVMDFCAEILRGAGVKSFAFNDVPSVTAEFYDEYESDYGYYDASNLYNDGHDFGLYLDDDDDESEADEPVDQYGYSLYDYSF